MQKQRLWKITLTEEQMCVMMSAVEDWHRFLCGECSMSNATSYIKNPAMNKTRDILDNQVKPAMFPELYLSQSYKWCGGQPNPYMSKDATISYMIYREIRHQLTVANKKEDSDTLLCIEQGPLIKVRPLDENENGTDE